MCRLALALCRRAWQVPQAANNRLYQLAKAAVWAQVGQKDPSFFTCGQHDDYVHNPDKCMSWASLMNIVAPPTVGPGRELALEDVLMLYENSSDLAISEQGVLVSGIKRSDAVGKIVWEFLLNGYGQHPVAHITVGCRTSPY